MENNLQNSINSQTIEPKSAWNYAFKWGLIGAVIYIIKTYFLFYSTDDYNTDTGGFTMKLLDIIVLVVIMIGAANEFKKNENNGFLSFGKAFKISYFTGIIYSVILALFSYVFLSFQVDYTKLYNYELDKGIKRMKDAGMTAEQIAKELKGTPEFLSTVEFACLVSLVMGFTLYAIFALISAAIAKRKEPEL